MNLSLIQRPKKVRADTKVLYIYAPSVLSEGCKLKPETIIKVLEVHEGSTPEETMLKVMEHDVWQEHQRRWYVGRKERCTIAGAKDGEYDLGIRPQCECEKPLAEMPEKLREATHYVLLSDIGK